MFRCRVLLGKDVVMSRRKRQERFGSRGGANIWEGIARKYSEEPEDPISRSIGNTTITKEVALGSGYSIYLFFLTDVT